MAESQNLIPYLSEMMEEYAAGEAKVVEAPEPGPTRLAGPNRNLRDNRLPLYHFIKIIYQIHAEAISN